MENWFKKAQVDNPEEVQNPTETPAPQQYTVEELVEQDPQIQELLQWFTKLKDANAYVGQAREMLTAKMTNLGVTNETIPPEINALFAEG